VFFQKYVLIVYSPQLWDVKYGAIKHRFLGHQREVFSVDFATNGKYIVSGSADHTVGVWDVEAGQNVLTLDMDDHVHAWSVASSPDGRSIAAGNGSGVIYVWDSRTGYPQNILDGHSGPVYSVSYSPDGMKLFSGSFDSTIRVWPLGMITNSSRTFNGHRVCLTT
jgi:glucose repression regulatory protein TUP1